ncbi:DUF4145 domain-containing protein [Sphingomonas flavescens]|uniref:DUF4145 domain-containing protein n=1 Tax=Sphingomonas flavescens TaxID=3132797 RepID=UPI002804AFE4|nr:DUF4145 domain-containing protein [Sphingomonas limnosediminicola]
MALNPKTGQRMGRASILTELKSLSKVRVKAVEIEDHIARLKSESDRGVMILAATLIEDALRTVLERLTRYSNSETREAIFGPDGPLGSFSRRIDFALATGLIIKERANGLHTIRFIRNAAAHAHIEVNFDTQIVKQALGTMLRPEQADDLETWPRTNIRNFYLQICGLHADQIIGSVEGPESIQAFFRTMKASDLNALHPSQ